MIHSNVREDADDAIVYIGDMAIRGFIFEDELCPQCGHRQIYHEDYDAEFCPICNIWLISACTDKKCSYCKDRPKKPLNTVTSDSDSASNLDVEASSDLKTESRKRITLKRIIEILLDKMHQ
ncbi:MAG: hypothetical protein PHT33_10615 [bacterium]|nr:hypothetical protein [bacterium]